MSDSKQNEQHGSLVHQGADHSAPYPVSRMAPAMELVDMAREIAAADNMLTTVSHARLSVIAEQIRALQAQARAVLEQTRRDQMLHRAACHFKRLPGRVYHLYMRADEALYFSMLSPQEWGQPPDRFVGSFRLENDMSWTPQDDSAAPAPDTEGLIRRLLQE